MRGGFRQLFKSVVSVCSPRDYDADVLVLGEPENSIAVESPASIPGKPESIACRIYAMNDLNPSRLLYEAAGVGNLHLMLHALALGADPNFQCVEEHGRTPLHRVRLSDIIPVARMPAHDFRSPVVASFAGNLGWTVGHRNGISFAERSAAHGCR